jgi:integrase
MTVGIRMLKEPTRRIRFLTPADADRLIEALPEHLRLVVQFMLATGCRMSQRRWWSCVAMRMRWTSISPE